VLPVGWVERSETHRGADEEEGGEERAGHAAAGGLKPYEQSENKFPENSENNRDFLYFSGFVIASSPIKETIRIFSCS
jgi:hypothetical protein